jgi:primary-amine oxidase
MPGTVNHADWSFSWSIPTGWGGGLVIHKARFKGDMVLYQGTIPFVLVPYHGGYPMFKDGLNHYGAPFTPVLPTAPNDHQASGNIVPASNDNQWDPVTNPTGAVFVQLEPGSLIEPAHAVIWTKVQCWNYQYIHRWAFHADGSIEVGMGLGGHLWTTNPTTSNHVHTFYVRLDFDIVSAGNNAVQEFAHPNNNPGADGWITLTAEGRRIADHAKASKWRVVNKAPKPNGMLRSYELTPASDMGPDNVSSTGDLWVLAYDYSQDGAAVGQTDAALHTTYLHGPGTVVNGADVVVWAALRHHHETRQYGEETLTLPYEFTSMHIEPRDFVNATLTGLYPTTPTSP